MKKLVGGRNLAPNMHEEDPMKTSAYNYHDIVVLHRGKRLATRDNRSEAL